MHRVAEMPRSPFQGNPIHQPSHRTMPILPSSPKSTDSSPTSAMDITPTQAAPMGPPLHNSPEGEAGAGMVNGGSHETQQGAAGHVLSAAAATSSQQPKIVQTAFIHKLYNMLEDPNIQHLISWSNGNESFVMSPSNDFSKVLAQYFKHTNISSFVRQLNMYGFHKVSDVFHTGSPESTLWEFKHGNGNFKRGDLAGLREIKRRASRHTLIHRDSFSTPHKPSISQPGTPAEPVPDVGDVRLANLEHSLYDMHARLMRTEESNTALSTKCQVLTESITKCHQWSHDICHYVLSLIQDSDNSVRQDISSMQKSIAQQLEAIRGFDDPHETLMSGRQPYFSNMAIDSGPLSPHLISPDERRPSVLGLSSRTYKPSIPSHLHTSPRRSGSIGTGHPSPNYHRAAHPAPAPPAPSQHPLASVASPEGPNLARRHTSADIRISGWPGHTCSPLTSSQSSSRDPSSPEMRPHPSEHAVPDPHIHNMLASYEFGKPRQVHDSNRMTPPPATDPTPPTFGGENGWSFASKFPHRHLESAPQTRRSSMASNVHSLLNPAETAEKDEDDQMCDDRKRKRLL